MVMPDVQINGFGKEEVIAWQLAMNGNPHTGEPADPYYFLKYFVKTRDEAAANRGEEAYRPFPIDYFHLQVILAFLYNKQWFDGAQWKSPIKPIVKGRQLTVTWICMAIILWEAIRKPGNRIATIAQKKLKTYEHQERMWDIIRHMNGQMVSDPNSGRVGEYHVYSPGGLYVFRYLKSDGQITIFHPDGHSESDIHAFTGKSSDARAYTLPFAYMEEVPWVPDALETYNALVPTVSNARGILPIVSTYEGVDELFYPLTIGDLEAQK